MNEKTLQHILSEIESKKLGETEKFEFKESFASTGKIMKAMAGMANNQGGLILIGITDRNEIRGVDDRTFSIFTGIHNTKFPSQVTSTFVPQIDWEPYTIKHNNVVVCVIHVAKNKSKPVIAKTNGQDISEGDIYYRYKCETKKVGFAELHAIIHEIKEESRNIEEQKWQNHLDNLTLFGIDNAGVLDPETRMIHNSSAVKFEIDEYLFEKLKTRFAFIKEGEFSESEGEKTLKLIGDIFIQSNKPTLEEVQVTDDSTAPKVQIEEKDLLALYPFSYAEMQALCREKCSETYSQYLFQEAINIAKTDQVLSYGRVHNPKAKKINHTYLYNSKAVDFVITYINNKNQEEAKENQ